MPREISRKCPWIAAVREHSSAHTPERSIAHLLFAYAWTMIARWLSISSALVLAACNQVSGLSDFEIGAGGQGGTAPQGGATGTAGSSDGGAAGSTPLPCMLQPVDSPTTTITWMPSTLTTFDMPTFTVTDTATPFTYVALILCTPTGSRVIQEVASIQCSGARSVPPCTWTFQTTPLPAGTTQAVFSAMRQTTVETTNVLVIK